MSCSSANEPCVLCANAPGVLKCSRANVPCVLTYSRANVPCLVTCSRCQRVTCFVLTCLSANMPCCLRTHMSTCFASALAHVPTCLESLVPNGLRDHVITCQHAFTDFFSFPAIVIEVVHTVSEV